MDRMYHVDECTFWYHVLEPGSNHREEILPLEEAVGIRAAAKLLGGHQGFFFYLKTG